ncbi:MAG: hypothetical protein LGB66_06545 [Sulfurovum sp.]|nr:hypothetical protein [Sulfurovum sp.]
MKFDVKCDTRQAGMGVDTWGYEKRLALQFNASHTQYTDNSLTVSFF